MLLAHGRPKLTTYLQNIEQYKLKKAVAALVLSAISQHSVLAAHTVVCNIQRHKPFHMTWNVYLKLISGTTCIRFPQMFNNL